MAWGNNLLFVSSVCMCLDVGMKLFIVEKKIPRLLSVLIGGRI